jgi:hypothetical protein
MDMESVHGFGGQAAAAQPAFETADGQPAAVASQNNTHPLPAAAQEPVGAGHVDKIRDILFGTHMREYDSRFSRIEDSFAKESAALRDAVQKRMDSLETFLKKELESLETRLRTEREERSAVDRQSSRDFQELGDSLRKRIGEVEDRAIAGQKDVREHLLTQSQQLRDEIHAKFEEVAALLDRKYNQLHSNKTDRSALASMLTEMALRLNDEFKIPLAGHHQ